jgi:Zn finger protein HypA/HybF involved in hydrogenase expression
MVVFLVHSIGTLTIISRIIVVMLHCMNCSNELMRKSQKKYCSNQCQGDHKYSEYLKRWLDGKTGGSRGILTQNMSAHVLRYIRESSGEACSQCGWDTVHPITGRVPLELDHVDGNSNNNDPQNLRMLCPNCHSLTSSYRNLNKGNGREWRRNKYIKSK